MKSVSLPRYCTITKFRVIAAFLVVSATSSTGYGAGDDTIRRRGEQIYRKSCLECHGDQGAGNDEHYADPLIGDASIGELSTLIAETMPEEDPDICVGEDAAAVAAFIHHSFYSEAAQVRNRPPRTRLSRLTGEQLRQSLAGVYGAFSDAPWIEDKPGLNGIYFNDDNWKDKKKKIERVDPVLDFNFGKEGPGHGIDPKEFYIHWSGSLKVVESGRYEIIVRSTCAFTMDFGRDGRELFNNHVQSEGHTEFRKSLHLTGGRGYMFKIDFFQRKRKTEQPPAQVSLSWIPPGGVEEIIPQENLLANWQPAAFALQAKLPADDRSYGYERGTSVSRQWDESITQAALEFSTYASSELWPSYRGRKSRDKDRSRLREFLTELVEAAHRAELSDQQREFFVDHQMQQAPDNAEAIRRVCLLTFKSPRFLYPLLDADQSISQRTANRLSLVLHDSLPSDRWLRKLIDKDKLKTDPELTDAAWRMVNDYRTQAKMRAFLYEWLRSRLR